MPVRKVSFRFEKMSPDADFLRLHDLITDMWARTPQNMAALNASLEPNASTYNLEFFFRDPEDLPDTKTLIDSVFELRSPDGAYGFCYSRHEILDCSPAELSNASSDFPEESE